MKYSIQEVAEIVGGELINTADSSITNVVFDGRKATAGSLFVPITWGNDGHNFIQGAIDNHASATLWAGDHQNTPTNFPTIVVQDTLKAFQKLAIHYLHQINPKVVAISGSNGKTTTKDFTAAIGATTFKTVKTPQNFNNEIGVPTTILAMPEDTELLVIEFGMDRLGDLDILSNMIQPDIAVLTMIGEAHIEFFKTRDRIADGKIEIVNGLRPGGTLVYNGDEPLLVERAEKHNNLKTSTFGLKSDNQLFATEIELTPVSASFITNQSNTRFTLPLTGRYNVDNALAAISVGHLLGISDEKIAEALENAPVTENRTEWIQGNYGGEILSDVYNANPTAMKEVLNFFQTTVHTTGKKIVVLGDMLELGTAGPQLHADIAASLDPTQVTEVFLIGELMQNLADALVDKYNPSQIHHYAGNQKTELTKALKATLYPHDLVLLKASHGSHLETIVEELRK
ncbi:MAG: UDP-N-acetylmuramoyl-tripeptide--D-alanyl-D-alanine ligase [Lactobacillaceae bacterium]|jgi:UDP-N-acetylmuramoyl-tripeptide--D-alanyl-D-alanine ligase|nr:UDP-N-acetylmuramoyl-tripeptide--D-alanyl-D-alanine ligase [Lactobacillaceae bacterium]